MADRTLVFFYCMLCMKYADLFLLIRELQCVVGSVTSLIVEVTHDFCVVLGDVFLVSLFSGPACIKGNNRPVELVLTE